MESFNNEIASFLEKTLARIASYEVLQINHKMFSDEEI